jgi:hypothetical protein
MEEFLVMKAFIFAVVITGMLGCLYVSQSPKAIGYLIVDDKKKSEKVLSELESIAIKFSYSSNLPQDISFKDPDIVFKLRDYKSENSSFTFFFNNLSGIRCITIGIYTDLPENQAQIELERFKSEILEAEQSLLFTLETCVGIEDNPSISDRNRN